MLAFAFACTLSACYEDDSINADSSVLYTTNIVKADGNLELTVKYMEEKEFAPELRYDGDTVNFTAEDYAKYDYLWRLSHYPKGPQQDTSRVTIGTGYPLMATIGTYPALFYNLLLEMTEKATGMKCLFTWNTHVQSGEVGQGLLIAYTHDDGASSDLALLRGYHYVSNNSDLLTADSTGKMPNALIMRDVFSLANGGQKADGVISSVMCSGKTTAKLIDIVVRDKHYYRLNPNTFQINYTDGRLFNFPPQIWAPKNAYPVPVAENYTRVFCINGISAHQFQIGSTAQAYALRYISLNPTDTAFAIHPDVCVTSSSTGFGAAQFWDTKRGRIVGMGTGNVITLLKQNDGRDVFDYNQLSNFEPLYAGLTQQSPFGSVWVLSEKGTGKRYCYLIRNENAVSPYGNYGAAIFDMSGCTDFDRSTAWATSLGRVTNVVYGMNQGGSWLYYAVGNKVYAVEMPLANQVPGTAPAIPTAKHVFTLAEGEEITHLRWHLERGSVFWKRNSDGKPLFDRNGTEQTNPTWTDSWSRNRMLTIASYNSTTKEGKIYAVPCPNPASGDLVATAPDDPDYGYIGQYGGFGKITALGMRDGF